MTNSRLRNPRYFPIFGARLGALLDIARQCRTLHLYGFPLFPNHMPISKTWVVWEIFSRRCGRGGFSEGYQFPAQPIDGLILICLSKTEGGDKGKNY